MTEIIKETVTSHANSSEPVIVAPVKRLATNSQTIEYLVYFLFGTLEVLLTFRLVLKLVGASISSAFVELIYGVTSVFILPFEGIFRRWLNQGVETTSVLEPATLVAIIVYAMIAVGIVKLVQIGSGEQQTE
jgi:hypothetical protein